MISAIRSTRTSSIFISPVMICSGNALDGNPWARPAPSDAHDARAIRKAVQQPRQPITGALHELRREHSQ